MPKLSDEDERGCGTLTSLHLLDSPNVTDECVSELATSLGPNTGLVSLQLGDIRGFTTLASLASLTALTALNITSCPDVSNEMLAALLPGARAVAAKSKGSGKGLAIAMGTVVAAAITMSLAQRQDVNLWPAKPFASEGLQRGNEEPGGGVGPEGSGENDGADEHGDSGEERGDDVDEDAGDGYESESVEGDAGMEEE